MVHGLINVVWLFLVFIGGNQDIFIWLPSAFFIGRELAQAEQRVISTYYNNKRVKAPWYCGFEKRAWTVKGLLDWSIPVGVTLFYMLIS